MAFPTYSDLKNLAFDRCQINVTTDAPVSDAEFARFINEALADVWEISGGSVKRVASATAWNSSQNCTGTLLGLLTDVKEILHIYPTTTAPAAITCQKNGTALLTSAALFGNIVPGMTVTGTGISSGTTVLYVTDASNVVLSLVATDSLSSSLTFSPTYAATEMIRKDLSYIQALRTSSGYGTYTIPNIYAVSRIATSTPASVGLLQLDYFPGTSGYYFPMAYTPLFAPIDSATVTTFDGTDLDARDAALMAAAKIAPLVGRPELVSSIMGDVSERTALVLARRHQALLDASQDR